MPSLQGGSPLLHQYRPLPLLECEKPGFAPGCRGFRGEGPRKFGGSLCRDFASGCRRSGRNGSVRTVAGGAGAA